MALVIQEVVIHELDTQEEVILTLANIREEAIPLLVATQALATLPKIRIRWWLSATY